ncbi:hypothetical protein [Marinicrinis lubricantis]|uniref:Uncharacterized protein n=1 Tax=Marinicrinis lubricantis TaxID=2086470 RepID=A0ABW1IP15_9BACL
MLDYQVSWDPVQRAVVIEKDKQKMEDAKKSIVSLFEHHIEAMNNHIVEQMLSHIAEESYLHRAQGQYYGDLFERTDLHIELQEIEIMQVYNDEATVYTKEAFSNENDAFYLDHEVEYVYSLLDLPDEGWQIVDVQQISIDYSDNGVLLNHQPGAVGSAVIQVWKQNEKALNDENLKDYLETLYKNTYFYDAMEYNKTFDFKYYNAHQQSEEVRFIGQEGDYAFLYIISKTTLGSIFPSYRTEGIYTFKKADGDWKLYDIAPLSTEVITPIESSLGGE